MSEYEMSKSRMVDYLAQLLQQQGLDGQQQLQKEGQPRCLETDSTATGSGGSPSVSATKGHKTRKKQSSSNGSCTQENSEEGSTQIDGSDDSNSNNKFQCDSSAMQNQTSQESSLTADSLPSWSNQGNLVRQMPPMANLDFEPSSDNSNSDDFDRADESLGQSQDAVADSAEMYNLMQLVNDGCSAGAKTAASKNQWNRQTLPRVPTARARAAQKKEVSANLASLQPDYVSAPGAAHMQDINRIAASMLTQAGSPEYVVAASLEQVRAAKQVAAQRQLAAELAASVAAQAAKDLEMNMAHAAAVAAQAAEALAGTGGNNIGLRVASDLAMLVSAAAQPRVNLAGDASAEAERMQLMQHLAAAASSAMRWQEQLAKPQTPLALSQLLVAENFASCPAVHPAVQLGLQIGQSPVSSYDFGEACYPSHNNFVNHSAAAQKGGGGGKGGSKGGNVKAMGIQEKNNGKSAVGNGKKGSVNIMPTVQDDPGQAAQGCWLKVPCDLNDEQTKSIEQTMKYQEHDKCKMKDLLQDLESIDAGCIVLARKITRLGFDSATVLTDHYTRYGKVEQVFVAHSRVKTMTRNKKHARSRLRPSGIAFIAMSSRDEANAILAAGQEQTIFGEQAEGVNIRVEGFKHSGLSVDDLDEEEA